MSFFKILLDGNSAKEREKKQICAIVIAITALLLVVAILAFVICQVVDFTANNDSDKEKDTQKETVDLGETTQTQLSDTAIYSGNLLTLNDNKHYKGEPDNLINIYDNRNGAFLSVRTANRSKFEATADTVENLCKMVSACNEAINDDNLLISNAYNTSEISSQKGIYSSGEAIALSYFNSESETGESPINEDERYKWIYSNAHKYGFIAVSSKSNVFRYVGETHAAAAKTSGLYLDNYLKQLKNATVDSPMKLNASGNIIAYTCPASDVRVPKNYESDTSGNNIDGIIVTVYLSKPINSVE